MLRKASVSRSRPTRPPFFTGITFYFAELPKVSLTLDGTLMGVRVTWPDLLGGGGSPGTPVVGTRNNKFGHPMGTPVGFRISW